MQNDQNRNSVDNVSIQRARLRGGTKTYLESLDIPGAIPRSKHMAHLRRSNPVMPVYQYPGISELNSSASEAVAGSGANYGREYRPNRGSYKNRASALQQFNTSVGNGQIKSRN